MRLLWLLGHDPITIKDATIAVSNQWGERNLPLFIEKAEAVGYSISLVALEESTDTKHYTYIKTGFDIGVMFGVCTFL